MRREGVLALFIVTSFLLLPEAIAHGPAGESTHLEGSLSLAPIGTAGSTSLLALSSLGEVEAGDELRYFWEVNEGQGPGVRFDLLQEMPGSTAELVYSATAATETETWVIPAPAEYTASWENPNSEAVTLSYIFAVLPPIGTPVAFDWPLYVGLGLAGVVFAVLFFWRGRRKKPAGRTPSVEETGSREK
ncbi:MAG: hypothetical protein LN413_04315 [Candidatus Thermoplasmatota archaeon]|nr:hypothetical protein [Candidatus Thermoplasmatota archaeon]